MGSASSSRASRRSRTRFSGSTGAAGSFAAGRAPGAGDCWHLSGIASAEASVLVTAFGRFGSPPRLGRGRSRRRRLRRSSFRPGVFVARGLSSPHSPRFVDGALAVCDSGRGELVVGVAASPARRLDARPRRHGYRVRRRRQRSARDGRAGPPRPRSAGATSASSGASGFPCARSSTSSSSSPAAARALARPGPAPRPTTPLRPADLRASVEAPAALRLAPGALATLGCTVTNLGSVAASRARRRTRSRSLRPGGPRAERCGRRFREPSSPASALARRSASSRLAPGRYVLELRLVQEGVAWLDGRRTRRGDRRVSSAVPDVLGPGLRLVFCGINPGQRSAAAGAHFANPRNDFWRLLHDAGFTPRLYEPCRAALAPRPRARADERRPPNDARKQRPAPERLRRLRRAALGTRRRPRPGAIAFVGKTAYEGAFRERPELGLQERRLGATWLFVFPSTSPANAAVPYAERLRWFRALRSRARRA